MEAGTGHTARPGFFVSGVFSTRNATGTRSSATEESPNGHVKGHGRPTSQQTPRTEVVILVTRLNGAVFALNPDLVERADCTPDTVITLVDGTKYVIAESVPEFIDSVRHYRSSLIAQASRMEAEPAATDMSDDEPSRPAANVLPLHRKER
ncbi:flagellar FlbD family protein [Actinoplanes sp. NPDC051494]|uniref:flagellar FlbD family protein n=1 Tax=Actinoplanes sp. NPDC051494 TaxID=3363907 RepID=UPI0037A984C4